MMQSSRRCRPYRIGMDYTAAARETAGIGRYARELIHAVLKADPQYAYSVMAGTAGLGAAWQKQHARLKACLPASRLDIHALPLTDDWIARLWQRVRVPIPAQAIVGRIDLFYSPNFVLPPLLPGTHSLLTIHDLSFLRHPETFTEALRTYLKKVVPRSVHQATRVITDSEATRQDVIALLGTDPVKVTTLLPGVSPRFTPVSKPDEYETIRSRYNLGTKPYVLAVGTVQPRKNYVRLMQALDPIADELDCQLVIVGRPGWLAAPILDEAEKRPFVRMLGFLDDADLPALLRQAHLLAFPSLYEGFGLPPLEAMACGAPVVASSASSVPEAVGQAGVLIDPLDTDAWTRAIHDVFMNPLHREALITRGFLHSAQFTWERAAHQWLSLIPEIARDE